MIPTIALSLAALIMISTIAWIVNDTLKTDKKIKELYKDDAIMWDCENIKL